MIVTSAIIVHADMINCHPLNLPDSIEFTLIPYLAPTSAFTLAPLVARSGATPCSMGYIHVSFARPIIHIADKIGNAMSSTIRGVPA